MTTRPAQIHSNETCFPITAKYLAKCKEKGWSTNCTFCEESFLIGEICHSKFNGIKYKKRHISCAVQIGLITKTDARIAIVGYSKMNNLDIVKMRPQVVPVNG